MALVQVAVGVDAAPNRALLDARLGELGGDVDLVVLPEASQVDFGAPDSDLTAAAEPLDGPYVDLLAQHARRLGATVIGGLFEARPGGLPFNTLAVVEPDGTLRATYRKIHLYDSFGYRESDRLTAGPIEPVVVDIAGVPTGLLTCYDLRFPELARLLVQAGAECLVVPAAWVAGEHKVTHWRTLLTARAIENTVHVVGVGQSGPRYSGYSLAAGPLGTILGSTDDDRDQTLVVDLDPAAVAAARDLNPALAHRRIRLTS